MIYYNTLAVKQTAATITAAMGLEPPDMAAEPLEAVLSMVKREAKSAVAQRVLIYNPDAIAQWLYQRHTHRYGPVMEHTSLALPLRSPFPPVTPVCFASMFSGAEPAVHGIDHYVKQLVTIDTLFDALPKQGVRTALVARDDSSMALIFTGRPITYYNTEESDESAIRRGLHLIEEGEHEVVVVYNMDYDDAIHDTEPESERSIAALERHINDFARLVEQVKRSWSAWDTLVVFAPDHGLHRTYDGGGDHFADSSEDMNVLHFYGVIPAR